MKDSYIQGFNNGDETFTIRYGLMLDDAWQPVQWTGHSIHVANSLAHVVDAAMALASLDECTSDEAGLPMSDDDSLVMETFVKKMRECPTDWGVTLFHIPDDHWCALAAHRKQYADGEWAIAEANPDAHIAMGSLNPKRASETIVWRRDITHRINGTREPTGIVKGTTPSGKARSEANRVKALERWKAWSGSGKWDAIVQNSGKPKGREPIDHRIL